MTEIVFQVEEDPDGGYTAKAVGASIFTEADTIEQLRDSLRDAVNCHFDKPLSDLRGGYGDPPRKEAL